MRKDELITYVVGLGTPRLIFEIVQSIDNKRITTAINSFSLGNGMIYGLGVLVLIGILSYQFSSYLILRYYRKKTENDRIDIGLASTDEILDHIDTYSISKTLREKLKTRYLLRNY